MSLARTTAPVTLDWPEIEKLVAGVDLIAAMEDGFVAYSRGRSVVPPVGELLLDEAPGEVHIKYGYIRGDEFYVVKIASGFFDNPKRGLPAGHGMMLLFSQATGEPAAILLDRGRLTDLRTGAAGAVAAKHLAPASAERIGIVGTGVQARRQLELLARVTECRHVLVAGRNEERLTAYKKEMADRGWNIETTFDPAEVADRCRVIVTTTPAREPLLSAADIRPGTHITAVGSDTPDKQELEVEILARADRVVADSISQCRLRGEISQALRAGALEESAVVELGSIIAGDAAGRLDGRAVTVADLTGVAVQDVRIADSVFQAYRAKH